MTVLANTIQAVSRVGVREDLADKIFQLFPDDCPFTGMIGRGTANSTYTEWQTDSLASASATNAAIQGDDTPNLSRANTTRVGTYTQISTKVVGVSTTVEAVNKAGRKSELARELMKAGRELNTDIELRATGNYASVAPAAGTAGNTAGALAWLTSNTSLGATGANGGFSAGIVAAATNGTQRAVTETMLKTVLQSAWSSGGNPKAVIVSGTQKLNLAAFSGLAQARRETNDKRITIVAGADFYLSDFGEVQFTPSRFCSTRDALIVDPEYWSINDLDGLVVEDLAQTGLAKRKLMRREWALVCRNQAASGVIRDLS
ncbi:MAG TPA: DUF5309 domain-containing protein [Novosphingobium sp.]